MGVGWGVISFLIKGSENRLIKPVRLPFSRIISRGYGIL